LKTGQKRSRHITCLGRFADKSLENEFFNYDIEKSIRHLGHVLLALSIFYVLFIIPDYILTKSSEVFIILLATRLVLSAIVIILVTRIKYIKNYKFLSSLISLCELFAIISYLVICYSYESPVYLIQAFGAIIIILSIFIIPNRLSNIIFLSLFLWGGFVLLSLYKLRDMELRLLIAGIGYILMVFVLSSISLCSSNYYKRTVYLINKELVRMSITDPLTGIYNRAKFDEEMKKWFEISKRYETPLSLVIFDFDDFKSINDKYGHLEGDNIITECVDVIKKEIRITDIFARWGGEEFVILLPNTNKEYAVELTERLRLMISSYCFSGVENLTCSFGVAGLEKNDTADTLLRRADKLLYQAKRLGKNIVIS
jgi:two-component system cell cycle response regulator